MTAFDDRERAFEAKFHLDEEMAFKVTARRDRLLGLWAAGKIGLAGKDAEDYARGIVVADLADAHHGTLMTKLHKDLAGAASTGEVEAEMLKLAEIARQQVMAELASGKQTIEP